MENKHFLELLKNYDFEAMSRAYRESEIAWSAKEWKEFIEKIVEERDEYWIKVADGMKDPGNYEAIGSDAVLSDLITRIKKGV